MIDCAEYYLQIEEFNYNKQKFRKSFIELIGIVMKLVEMQNKRFHCCFRFDTPAPGGGSASALAAAQGIAFDKDGDRTHDWQKNMQRFGRRN